MFEPVKSPFGFGCMRLVMKDGKVDDALFTKLIDAFLEGGFNYFDTAHGYLDGESETAIGRCLCSRIPRESFTLTNKLTEPYFNSREEIRPFFESQLAACQTDYFDFYLMHAQNRKNYEHFKKHQAYETALELKEEGKIRHLGISFHDTAEILDQILTEHPEIEVVQLQLNYLDWDDENIQSRLCYETAVRHGKKVIVMEPVKGGTLADLPDQARDWLAELSEASQASYALRFAASQPEVFMVLSGMNSMEQMEDNISVMSKFKGINDEEQSVLDRIVSLYRNASQIGCTACSYCTAGCPAGIEIPKVIKALNLQQRYMPAHAAALMESIRKDGSDPADCIGCQACEHICPQNLPIHELMAEAAKTF